MKASEFKILIKESVKEVFQEELKEIILESLRSNNSIIGENSFKHLTPSTQQITHNSGTAPSTLINNTTSFTDEMRSSMRKSYMDVISETAQPIQTHEQFNPAGADSINGSLPEGELSMSQIMALTSRK